MIVEALRRLLVRYFKVPATSVSPQKGPPGTEPLLTVRPGAFGFYTANVEYVAPPWKPDPVSIQLVPPGPWTDPRDRGTGIKPPRDPEVDVAWTWAAWDREYRAMAIDGWTPCRFAHRNGDAAVFVFGVVKGPFGLWRQPMPTCWTDDNGKVFRSNDILTCAVHIRSGVGIGVFARTGDAATACDIAARAYTRWDEVAEWSTQEWQEAEHRVLNAWWDWGIVMAQNRHCHSGDQRYAIYGLNQQTVMDGKPEKLS